jgi:hypothetical protein
MSLLPKVPAQSVAGVGLVIGDPFTSDCRKASMAWQSAALRVSFHTATVSFAVALMSL